MYYVYMGLDRLHGPQNASSMFVLHACDQPLPMSPPPQIELRVKAVEKVEWRWRDAENNEHVEKDKHKFFKVIQ